MQILLCIHEFGKVSFGWDFLIDVLIFSVRKQLESFFAVKKPFNRFRSGKPRSVSERQIICIYSSQNGQFIQECILTNGRFWQMIRSWPVYAVRVTALLYAQNTKGARHLPPFPSVLDPQTRHQWHALSIHNIHNIHSLVAKTTQKQMIWVFSG